MIFPGIINISFGRKDTFLDPQDKQALNRNHYTLIFFPGGEYINNLT